MSAGLRWTILCCVYAGYILLVTLHPFEVTWNVQQFPFARFFRPAGTRDFVLNIFLFIPFGFLAYPRLALKHDPATAILLATLVGSIFSTGIELLQISFNRHPSAFDVLSNALGTSLGAVVFARFANQIGNLGIYLRSPTRKFAVLGACAALAFAAIPLLLTIAQLAAPFRVWDWRHSLQIGNEATLNRPWLGKVYFVALYNRALPPEEIWNNFREGLAAPAAESRPGLLALYRFNEGSGKIVHDVSQLGQKLDLTISPERHVRWLEDSSGIEILRPAILKNGQAGVPLVTAVNATQEVAIEAWVTPRNTTQSGPARIVSFSRHGGARNFTVAQHGSQIVFRLRTPVSGRNGTPLALASDEVLAAERSHVVTTYKDGVTRVYINGEERPVALDMPSEGVVGFGTRKTLLALIAYSFFYFFPVSFFSAILLFKSSKTLHKAILPSLALGIGLLATTDMVQAFAFQQAINIPLMGSGLVVLGLGALAGAMYARAATVYRY